jgi:pimeloyl-ACP methyl ester carboxylesterase
MAHYIIYFPGLGDDSTGSIQQKAIKKWQKYGISTYYLPMHWQSEETYSTKLERALRVVDELGSAGHQISLVGASAGASMAMNTFASRKDKIISAVFISGKINRPRTMGSKYTAPNPALMPCVEASSKAVAELTKDDKQKMLILYPLYDGTVTKDDSFIPGVKVNRVVSMLHSISIYMCLTIFKIISINFIKSKSVQ